MYDMSRVTAKGYFDANDSVEEAWPSAGRWQSSARRTTRRAPSSARVASWTRFPRTRPGSSGLLRLLQDAARLPPPFAQLERGLERDRHAELPQPADPGYADEIERRHGASRRRRPFVLHGQRRVRTPHGREQGARSWPGAVHTDLYDGGGKDAIPWIRSRRSLRRIWGSAMVRNLWRAGCSRSVWRLCLPWARGMRGRAG